LGRLLPGVGEQRSRTCSFLIDRCRKRSRDPSLPTREALQGWCEGQKAALVAVFEDIGVSGAAPLEKRPGLAEALERLAEEGAGVLLVA